MNDEKKEQMMIHLGSEYRTYKRSWEAKVTARNQPLDLYRIISFTHL